MERILDSEADPSSRLDIACESKPGTSKANGVLGNVNRDSFFGPCASTSDGCTEALIENKREA